MSLTMTHHDALRQSANDTTLRYVTIVPLSQVRTSKAPLKGIWGGLRSASRRNYVV